MILVNAPQNEAILSNVGEIGEFRIRNSAKAFSILSSGLYANKIRAIIRELSCNAVDSHVEAGKASTPFDVHMPNQLEPWFAIRDYGTGLTHEQVVNIYTTYFESTKTGSNEYVGALGLGSKSPFSYTDNFTVTAIKDGQRGIYSAFINGEGVPSIALMMTEPSTEPAGVEVKFSVNDRWDFDKFKSEARNVYTYFTLRPVISGAKGFEFYNPKFTDVDIIPGVSANSDNHTSYAIMGNISYPIAVPDSDKTLGEHRKLLACGLTMYFDIGELDFQASREGLSYIPQTIEAIKRKLVLLTAALTVRLKADADKIENKWERALFLNKKLQQSLWASSVEKYVADTKFDLFTTEGGSRLHLRSFSLTADDLKAKFNIVLRGFEKSRGRSGISLLKPHNKYVHTGTTNIIVPTWELNISEAMYFVENNTKVGVLQRAKYHWKRNGTKTQGAYSERIYVLEKADKYRLMNVSGFFSAISNPPESVKMLGSELDQPERASGRMKNVTILKLERKDDYRRGRRGYSSDMVWRDAGKMDDFDKTATHYYMPISGWKMESKVSTSLTSNELYQEINSCGIPSLGNIEVYGVRKTDIEAIKARKNWVNLETFIAGELNKIDARFMTGMVMNILDNYELLRYNSTLVELIKSDSPFVKFVSKLKDIPKISYSEPALNRLATRYAPKVNVDTKTLRDKFSAECKSLYVRYPLLKVLDHDAQGVATAQYINLIDKDIAQKAQG